MPLTVLAVHQAVRDVYGSASHYGDDAALTEKAKEAAQAETDQVLAAAGSQPTSVTVTAVHGLPVDELIKASESADMIVLGRRGYGRFRQAADGLREQPGRPARAVPGPDRAVGRLGPGSASAIQRVEWAPVIMAARSSGCRKEGGGGGPQANSPRAPSRSSGVQSWSSMMQSMSL